MPTSASTSDPKICTVETIRHIQYVIKNTCTPSWINSVPSNYGEASAGSIKADEWRILSTVYLPIALVTLWGYENGSRPAKDYYFVEVLDHTMMLFQAVNIICRDTMNQERALKYRTYMQRWTEDLHRVHPHTKKQRMRVNVHAALHLYDFTTLFGPIMSWWSFPFERLIGTVQKINTNDLVGGEGFQACLICFLLS